tara:strand:+ start:721 stop:1128 length:408 start_codon:yes stop_codon:yes gene_type:complete
MSEIIEISYRGKTKKVPKTYLPDSLSKKDKQKQIKSIFEKKERPNVKFKEKRSSWAVKFEDEYGVKITDTDFIDENILKKEGQEQIILKGKGAYYSSGSRPNQNAFSWGYGRLASVIMGGKSRKIDMKIWEKYKV